MKAVGDTPSKPQHLGSATSAACPELSRTVQTRSERALATLRPPHFRLFEFPPERRIGLARRCHPGPTQKPRIRSFIKNLPQRRHENSPSRKRSLSSLLLHQPSPHERRFLHPRFSRPTQNSHPLSQRFHQHQRHHHHEYSRDRRIQPIVEDQPRRRARWPDPPPTPAPAPEIPLADWDRTSCATTP